MVEEQQRLGRYELLAEIGRGAMGVVYKARDPIIDRVLAIKTVDFRGLGPMQAEVQQRFFQEAQSAGRLSHSNIVTIYDAGEAEGCAYIAMELLEGASLREVLDQNAPLSISRALEIAGQIARGLAYAHEHGVVHRDVKPANVILVARRVKITDFGIARLPFGSANARSELAGSPKYMSPEQVLGEDVDGRSDLFSLGTVLYEMLTGRQPFVGDSVSAIMQAVVRHDPPPPSTLNPKVTADIDAFVMRVLSKKPEDRPPSARAMLREVGGLLKAAGGSPYRSSRHEERRRHDRLVMADVTTILQPPSSRKKHRVVKQAPATSRRWWYGAATLIAAGVLTAMMTVERKPAQPMVVAAASTTTPAKPQPAPKPAPVQVEEEPSVAALEGAFGGAEPALSATQPPASERPATKPRARKSAKTETAAASSTNSGPTATILVAVAPWGEIYVDGQSRGMAPPLAQIEVPAGRRRIEIRNGNLPPHAVDINIAAGDTRRIKHKFE